MELERKMTSVSPIEAKIISYGSLKGIKMLNRRLHWRMRGIVCQHDPRQVDVLDQQSLAKLKRLARYLKRERQRRQLEYGKMFDK